MRRIDVGCAVFGKPDQLPKTIAALQKHSVTDWRLFLIVNPHPKHDMRELVCGIADRDPRIVPVWLESNIGYAGACNTLLATATTEYIAYLDDDAEINTPGWDETLCAKLDAFHEVGLIFPNGGSYMIDRGNYQEVLWGVGFCWVMNRMCATDLSLDLSLQMPLRTDEQYDRLSNGLSNGRMGPVFDTRLGHQEEADVAQRVRMAGWKCAAVPAVSVSHKATATNDPASLERINRGVVNWCSKWNRYFNGKNFNYHSPNVTRFEDWPPNALYLEEYWKIRMPDLNTNPKVVKFDGREYDLIEVPRFKDFYRGRIF